MQTDERGLEQLRKLGKAIRTDPPPDDWITYVNPRTGEVAPVPRGIDPGFAYNPGKARDEAFFAQMLRKAALRHAHRTARRHFAAAGQRPRAAVARR